MTHRIAHTTGSVHEQRSRDMTSDIGGRSRARQQPRLVTLRSQGNETLEVEDPHDATFLELADTLAMKAQAVRDDPRRRRRLRRS